MLFILLTNLETGELFKDNMFAIGISKVYKQKDFPALELAF